MVFKYYHNESWGYIDGVREVHVKEVLREEAERELEELANICRSEDCIDRESRAKYASIINCFWGDNSAFVIVTNQAAYLLNDKGQTIERLV